MPKYFPFKEPFSVNLLSLAWTCIQRQGVVSESDMKKIRKYIKLNHETMFEVWSQNSVHGYYGENR